MKAMRVVKPLQVDEKQWYKIMSDPVLFCTALLGLNLRYYQKGIIRDCILKDKVAVRMARQTGKSTIVAAFCLYWCLINPKQSVIIVSRTHNQAKNLFEKIKALSYNSIYIKSKIIKDYTTEMEFTNGSKIRALPSGNEGATIRGYTSNIVILEEAAYISDYIVESVVIPMLSAIPDGKIIQISTPVGGGQFFDCFKDDSGYARHHYTYEDAIKAGHFTRSFIEDRKKSMDKMSFEREYNANFTEDEGTALPWSLVSPCIDQSGYSIPEDFEYMDSSGEFKIGYDVGRFGSSAVFVLAKKYLGVEKIIYFKELVKTPYEEQWDFLLKLCNKFNPKEVIMDATGMGAPIAERFASDKRTSNFKLTKVTFSTKSKHQMFMNFIKLLEDRLIVLPNDNRLLNQIANQRFRVSGDYRIYSTPDRTHDDILISTILAVFKPIKGEAVGYTRSLR